MNKFFYLLVSQLLFLCASAQLSGKVVSIADGDTFTILTRDNKQLKVRLHGVDAPEKLQPFANQSSKFLSHLIFGKWVRVDSKTRDRYRRVVGVAYVGNVNVNEALLQAGFAWHYKAYDKTARWAGIEQRARLRRAGLWSHAQPVAPWQWRSNRRSAPKKASS